MRLFFTIVQTNARFETIYYAHVNEDNTIARDLLFLHQPCTLYCITGSGERLISLLDAPGLSKVVAIDSNPEANFLLELKFNF